MSVHQPICPTCGKLNSPQAIHCQYCGESLDATISQDLNLMGQMDAWLRENPNAANAITTAPPIPQVASGNKSLNPNCVKDPQYLKLTDIEVGFQYVVIMKDEDFSEITLGRPDRENGFSPTIDLTFVDGHMKGVSRFHAIIKPANRGLTLSDNASSNGTYLNGERLLLGQSRILRDGDCVDLGRVKLQVNLI